MRNLNLLVIRCGNIERSKAFYELFGMAFKQEQHGNGPKHYNCTDEEGVFEIYPLEGASADQTGLGFLTGDLEGLHMLMRRNQFAPREIRDTELGRMFVVRDPDGRRVEVKARA
ncbi:MAG TPA: VOC family protein [Phycisphaerae bacterium]|jgi:catechol 2,3-dioxygenase-like lactoylglutathione lyase family enzyme